MKNKSCLVFFSDMSKLNDVYEQESKKQPNVFHVKKKWEKKKTLLCLVCVIILTNKIWEDTKSCVFVDTCTTCTELIKRNKYG